MNWLLPKSYYLFSGHFISCTIDCAINDMAYIDYSDRLSIDCHRRRKGMALNDLSDV